MRASDWASSPVGTFRIATSMNDAPADYRDGLWAGAGPLTWTSAPNSTSIAAYRPHAMWWKRCAAGSQTDARVFAEGDLGDTSNLGVEVEVSSCPHQLPSSLPYYPCDHSRLTIAMITSTGHDTVAAVDTSEAGVVKTLTDREATIVTPSGGTISVTWSRGRVAWSWETGFALSGATESDLTFVSKSEKFDVESDGKLVF